MGTGDLSAVGRTAFAVALARAAEAERQHPWFVDPLAIRLAASVPQATKERVGLGLTAWIAVRTRFLDELVLYSAERGIRQLVMIGAGLDARAFRLGLPEDLAIYELDREDVFAAKRRIMRAAGLASAVRHEIAADVLAPGWLDAVRAAGWHGDEPTLWILEGFLIYFDSDVRAKILSELATVSAVGSALGVTMSTRTDEPRHPLWKPFDNPDIDGWFASCGWRAEMTDMTDASSRYGRPLPSELAERVNGLLVSAHPVAG
jgi:methyltransferase (TIGR00027 family)